MRSREHLKTKSLYIDNKQSVIDLSKKGGAYLSLFCVTGHRCAINSQGVQSVNPTALTDTSKEKPTQFIDEYGFPEMMGADEIDDPFFTQLIPSHLNPTHVRSFVCRRLKYRRKKMSPK